jgi:hypothetical protein
MYLGNSMHIYFIYICHVCVEIAKAYIFLKGLGLWCLPPLSTIPFTSVILWRSVSLVEETGVLGKKHRPDASD